MAHPLTIKRPQDEHSRLVRDCKWTVRGAILLGTDTVTGEELLFKASHVRRVRRVDTGPDLRPKGIKFEEPRNVNEPEYFRLLDEIERLRAELA